MDVLELVQLVFNIELLAISSMSEVRSERKVCLWAFLRFTKGFVSIKKITQVVIQGHTFLRFFWNPQSPEVAPWAEAVVEANVITSI